MDKLRSLRYFIAAADSGSFSQAARRLEVTIPAVAKMVNALERDLGVALFERSARGLALTANGEAYLEQCRPAVEQLGEADERLRTSAARPRGTLVVGVQHLLANWVLAEALPRFHARYPEIHVDLRSNTQVTGEEDLRAIDAFLSLSWPDVPDMIHRRIGSSRFRVCASPEYWARHGMPLHPRDLERHNCLTVRTQRGAVMDLWNFARGEEKVPVVAKGWLTASNTHRDTVIRLVIAGHGVMRLIDLTNQADFEEGRLVEALTDWQAMDTPPVSLSYWPSGRRTARVRVFLDFAAELFRELDERRGAARVSAAPRWTSARYGRASAMGARGRTVQSRGER